MRLMGIRVTIMIVIGLVAAAALAISLFTLLYQGDLVDDITKTNQEVTALRDRNARLELELYNLRSEEYPALLAESSELAFPELRIAIPFNDKSKTLRYTVDPEGDLRLTSTLDTDNQTRQLSCSQLVRLSLVRSTPYSPWEEKAGSVALGDGRTLHIIATKAFKNNQASTEECSQVWQAFTPQQVADTFKRAHSY